MGFRIDLSPTFKWPVTAHVIDGDGVRNEVSFTLEFARMTQKEVEQLIASAGELKDADFVHRIIRGWAGIDGPDGPLIFSPETLSALCNIVGMQAAIVRAWFDYIQQASTKNS